MNRVFIHVFFRTESRRRDRPDRGSRRACLLLLLAGGTGIIAAPSRAEDKQPGIQVRVSFGPEVSKTPLDGRLLVMLSTDPKEEPRFQINDTPKTQQIFGIDVDGLAAGTRGRHRRRRALGYPLESLGQVPPGKYRVQALLHKYETFHRADGHTVKLPMDRGEGQQWNKAPGNLYSTPKEITIEPAQNPPATIRSCSTRSSRRFPIRRRPSTSSTSGSRASG